MIEKFQLGPMIRLGTVSWLEHQRVKLETWVRILVQARIFSLKLLNYIFMALIAIPLFVRYTEDSDVGFKFDNTATNLSKILKPIWILSQ